MAGSPVDICNLALGHLRQDAIMSLTDRSPSARECKRFYDEAIRASLRAFDWSFARAYSVAVPFVGVPKPGWQFVFAVPVGCVRMIEIAHDKRVKPPRFEITRDMNVPADGSPGTSGLVIHTNVAMPTLIYTIYVGDVTAYDPTFVLAASYNLASLLAMPLTGKVSLVDAMGKKAQQMAAQARVDAANEEPNDVNDQTGPDWIRGRGGSRFAWMTQADGTLYPVYP